MSQTEHVQPPNDDTLQCLFFSCKLGSDVQLLQKLCDDINNFIKDVSKDYIWHRDEFKVYIPIIQDNSSAVDTLHLCSTTCFGENLEDEWFIVYIVLEISKMYEDLVIQIKDSDGDFLLIEAANYLQSWANPDTTENRVFIHGSHIHIIPPTLVDLQNILNLKQALEIINNQPELTQASREIEQAILNRIGNYPEKITDSIYRAVVKLPATVATLLTLKPSLISPIIDTYCNHDVIDAKCCKNVEFQDCIQTEVKFTKFLYAALMHSKLIPAAKNIIGIESDKKTILGFKLMCGYQMLMNKTSGEDLFSSKEYHRFINNLKCNGYFGNNLEGSKDYTSLMERAQQYFSDIESPMSSSVYLNISDLMSSSNFKKTKNILMKSSHEYDNYIEDSDEWLNIHPEQLNELLNKNYGKKIKFKNNDVVSSQTLTQELTSFLKATSDFEGIEQKNESEQDNFIDFESDQFVTCIDKMLKMLSTGGNEDCDSNDSDDFHSMDYEENEEDDDNNTSFEAELQAELQDKKVNLKDTETVLANIIQSMKEEQASTGPSSNLLRSIGLSKTEILDSDDDDDTNILLT